MHGLREESTPPLEQRGHAESGEHRDDPAEEEIRELRTGFTPVCPDLIRDEGSGQDAEHCARESETCATVPRRIPLATNETIRIRTIQSGHV